MRYYVFDLDNTLVFTDALNNEAYNFVLKKFGLSEIRNVGRITREVVFQKYPEIEKWKDEIIALKQKFFLNNLERTFPAKELLIKLKNSEKCRNILWTSAEETRVIAILEYYKIAEKFRDIVFDALAELDKLLYAICE